MRIIPRLAIIVVVLAISVVAVSPVLAANNDSNKSLAPAAWPPQPPYGWPQPSGCYTYYRVQWGNTLSGIAAYYRTSVWSLMAANPIIWNPNIIYAGQVLCIPYPTYGAYPAYPVYPMNPIYPGNPAPAPY